MTGTKPLTWIWSTEFFDHVSWCTADSLGKLDCINTRQNLFIYIELIASCAALEEI